MDSLSCWDDWGVCEPDLCSGCIGRGIKLPCPQAHAPSWLLALARLPSPAQHRRLPAGHPLFTVPTPVNRLHNPTSLRKEREGTLLGPKGDSGGSGAAGVARSHLLSSLALCVTRSGPVRGPGQALSSYCVKTHITKCTILSVQFSGIRCIHTVVRLSVPSVLVTLPVCPR